MNNEINLSLMDGLIEKYASVPGSLITLLQGAQDIYGYLPKEILLFIAEKCGLSPAHVTGVASFYTQFRFAPIGKYRIMLCKGTACHVNGSDNIARAIMDELSINDGETTSDGLFTLTFVACLGCCSLSPAMMINNNAYGSLTPSGAIEILRGIKKKEALNGKGDEVK